MFIRLVSIVFFISLLTSCSGGEMSKESHSTNDYASDTTEEANVNEAENKQSVTNDSSNSVSVNNQMIIYKAFLSIEVNDFNKAKDDLQRLILNKQGYIAHSSSHQLHNGLIEGSLLVRIPQEHFQLFLDEVEEISTKIHNQTIEGMDVTEEFVDLSSRLKSKEAVEQRLLQFMKDAQKTEDLLKISSDLGVVQEEIEQLKGKIHYLENQVSLSTVEITLSEDKVIVSSMNNHDLNTWEKAKQQFMNSLQFLLSLCSGIIIFFIGNSPIILTLAFIISIACIIYHKNKNKKKNDTSI